MDGTALTITEQHTVSFNKSGKENVITTQFPNERALLANRLQGQNLVIPDMWPIFAGWPRGQHDSYVAMKKDTESIITQRFTSEEIRKELRDIDPALLAARWWPTASLDRYGVMTNLVIWFGNWDDCIEKLSADPTAAEEFRCSTKYFIRQSIGLGEHEPITAITNPMISSFSQIATEICAAYDHYQRTTLLRHFDQYIDATRLEAENENGQGIPSLEDYWKVRILTSGMGTLLSLSEFAVGVKLPPSVVESADYETLWITTVVINSIVNDLISMKKEMKAGSVLNSVAILFHGLDDLDAAVQVSLNHLQQLVGIFDSTADRALREFAHSHAKHDALSRVIELFRTVNTGNLWWSLQSPRYGVAPYMEESGQIELVL